MVARAEHFKSFPGADELLRVSGALLENRQLCRDDRTKLGALFYHVGVMALDDKKAAADLLARGLRLKRGGASMLDPVPKTNELAELRAAPNTRFHENPQAAGAYLLAIAEEFLGEGPIYLATRTTVGQIFRDAAFTGAHYEYLVSEKFPARRTAIVGPPSPQVWELHGSKEAAAKRIAQNFGLLKLDKDRKDGRWKEATRAARNGATIEEICRHFDLTKRTTPRSDLDADDLDALTNDSTHMIPRFIEDLHSIALRVILGIGLPVQVMPNLRPYVKQMEVAKGKMENDGAYCLIARRYKGSVPLAALKYAIYNRIQNRRYVVCEEKKWRHVENAINQAKEKNYISIGMNEDEVSLGDVVPP